LIAVNPFINGVGNEKRLFLKRRMNSIYKEKKSCVRRIHKSALPQLEMSENHVNTILVSPGLRRSATSAWTAKSGKKPKSDAALSKNALSGNIGSLEILPLKRFRKWLKSLFMAEINFNHREVNSFKVIKPQGDPSCNLEYRTPRCTEFF
jgi:hypothetical protein